jgi:hypothetical protein
VNETRELTFDDVIRAGRVLFGATFAAEEPGWRHVLRDVYRRRAMETHPDRARALGRGERELACEFRAVAEAYRVLSSLRAAPVPAVGRRPAPPARPPAGPPPPPPRPARRAAASPPGAWTAPSPRAPGPAAAPRVRAPFRAEALPDRRLRFAEFLYYAGRVRWSELVDAVAWQRRQRPPIGRLAVEHRFLAHDDVGVILERRREAGANATPFGEWAVRLGYLTPFQVLALLGIQLRMQRPIGQWFVARGIVGPDEIDAIRGRIFRHNARFARETPHPVA